MNIIFTVCNRTNLSNALALGRSVMQHSGNIFYLCWADSPEPLKLPENVRLLTVSEINIPEWPQMIGHYYDFELLPACRPWFAKHLINLHPDQVTFTFFAPTVLLLKPVEEIFVRDAGIILTPHTTSPLQKSAVLDDKRILNIGMFHAGSWILNKSEESLKFLDWWAVRTIDRAKFDLCNGMCMDQLWLNFALVRIKDAHQISHSGWHFGLHSVLSKKLEFENGHYLVNGNPLISIDFAGLDFFDPIWSDQAVLLSQNQAFKKLFSEYKKNLSAFQSFLPSESKPTYGLIPDIRKNRMMRKKIEGKLKSITAFIDQFQFN
ncbi:hypothetical protein [Dyadobacter sp. NIV53]|uniref:hypothetical protein n=1 Tax=Dyadobacter sp. NIV53 TaxID=2861765 RepID=UPI001C88AB6D|nr:hypothetical protein [Dyadobacter sp. NIV53]